MFNVGGGELLVILVIALIVLGPKRLPEAARQVGKTMGELRRLSTGFQNEVKSALTEVEDAARVAPRRNVLAKDIQEAPTPATDAAIESVSDAAPPPPPKRTRSTQLRAAPTEPADEPDR